MVQHINKYVAIIGLAILVLGNAVMLTPRQWTFAQFMPFPMSPAWLQLHQDSQNSRNLILEDRKGELVPDGSWNLDIPLAVLDRYLDRRRMRHYMNSVTIQINIASKPSGSAVVEQVYEGPSVRQAVPTSPIRFVFEDLLDLPPGEYEVSARLFSTTWGPERMKEAPYKQFMGPVWPGTMLIRDIVVDPITVIIDGDHFSE